MAGEYDFPMVVIVQRPSARQVVRRNIKVNSGDDFRIVVTAYADEDAGAPLSTAGLVAQLIVGQEVGRGCWEAGVWRDYAFPWSSYDRWYLKPRITVQGAIQDNTGQVFFPFQPPITQNMAGRYPFQIQLQSTRFGATVLRGFLDIERGFVLPGHDTTVFVLDESFLDGPDELADG